MKKRLFHCTLAILPGLALSALLLWLGAAIPARAAARQTIARVLRTE